MPGDQPGPPDALATEAEKILSSPGFQRSEVLTRLLQYLVRMTLEGRTVKAFEVAVDGLGRDERESVDSDTYARVVVARLRKALASYYATGSHDAELHIDPGSYIVRLKRCETRQVPDEVPPAFVTSTVPGRGPARIAVLGLLGAGLVLALIIWFLSSRSDERVWNNPNFPNLSVARLDGPVTPEAEECRREMITALGGYTGLRLVETGTPADYEVRLFRRLSDGKDGFLVRLVHLPTKRFLWSYSASGDNSCLGQEEMQRVAYTIASPGGLVESFARRNGIDSDTPFGCWLRFTESIRSYNTIGNSELEVCASEWYSHSPEHPVAAFLLSWTLMDKAAAAPLDSTRTRLLSEASDIVRQASLLNSEYAPLHIARMRAASFRGDRKATLAGARRAIAHSQQNPVIIGMAASGLAMWNDPEGERILLSRAGSPEQQMPWENTALFVAAMMRDDPQAAGEQIERLAEFDAGQPVLRILQAAWLARIGKRRESDAALARLEEDPRIWIAGRDELIRRLPMAPEVKSQLKRWLATGAKPD